MCLTAFRVLPFGLSSFGRSNAGLKTDHSNQKLRNAEIVFPAESPRLYKVHFPKEKPAKTERHYKISGPVTPDSVRYQ